MNSLKQEWDAIDAAQGSLDSRKWKLAERLAKENDAGRTIDVLAGEVGREKSVVGRWIQVHRKYGVGAGADKPASFARAIEELRGKTPESERARKDVSATKSTLRDPDKRAKALDALEEDDLLDVAADAAQKVSEKAREKGWERKRNARANREERSADPSGTHLKLIRLDLAKADDAIARAVNTARDAGWSKSQTEQLLARIVKTEGLLDVLKLAVSGETDIDWDAELADLIEEERAA